MADTRKLTLKIVGDAKSALGALGQMGDASEGFGTKLKGLTKKAGVAFAAIGAGAAVIGKQFVNAASDMQESLSKVNVVFGENASEVIKFSKTAATAMGLSSQQALEAAGTYGNLFQAFGLSRDSATEMSTSLVQLASDLASFNNVPVDDALLALRSGLSGETEPLKRFGVALNDERLKAEAFAMGIYSGSGALTAGAKAQAAYALILKDTTLAQGDYARTADGVANRQRTIAAQFKDIQAGIGTALLPAFGALLGVVSNKVVPVFQQFASVAGEKGLGAAVSLMAGKVKENAPKLLASVQELISKSLDWVVNSGIPQATAALGKMGEAFVNWIGPRIGPMLLKLQELAFTITGYVLNTLLPRLTALLVRVGEALTAWVSNAIPGLVKSLQRFVTKLGDFIVNTVLPRLVENVKKLGAALVDWVGPVLRELPAKLVELAGTIVGVLVSKVIPAVLKATPGLLWAMTKWVASLGIDLIVGVSKAFFALLKALPKLAVELGKGFLSLGKSLMSALGNGIGEIANVVKNKLIGFVNYLIDKFNSIPLIPNIDRIKTDSYNAADALNTMGAAATGVVETAKQVTSGFTSLRQAEAALSQQTNTTSSDLGDLADSLSSDGGGGGGGGKGKGKKKSVKDALKEAQDQFRSFTGALQSVGTAQKEVTAATRGTAAAQADLTAKTDAVAKAQANLEQIARGYGAGSKQATTAQQTLEQAQRDQTRAGFSVEQATFAIAEAEKSLADARIKNNPQAIREAEIALAEAKMALVERQLEQKQAIADTAAAQTSLNEATSGAAADSTTYKDALTLLQEAQQAQRDAINDVAEAKDRERDATWKLVDAEKALLELRGKTQRKNAAAALAQYKERGGELSVGAAVGLQATLQTKADFLKMVNKQFSTKYKSVNEYVKAGKGATQEANRKKRYNDFADANGLPKLFKGGIVTSPTFALLGEKGPEAVMPLPAAAYGGTTIVLNVTAGIGSNGTNIGRQIVDELVAYQRRVGALPIKVAG